MKADLKWRKLIASSWRNMRMKSCEVNLRLKLQRRALQICCLLNKKTEPTEPNRTEPNRAIWIWLSSIPRSDLVPYPPGRTCMEASSVFFNRWFWKDFSTSFFKQTLMHKIRKMNIIIFHRFCDDHLEVSRYLDQAKSSRWLNW